MRFVVPADARFNWFSGSNIVKDRAPAPSEYNVEHINTLIAHASPFLRFPEEFLCWVGISRNYLLNKDTYPRFEYEDGEGMDLNAFIRTADPRKVRIVERPRAENERPIVTVAKHRTVTLLPTSVVRSSGELSASVEREFAGDASVGDGGDQGFDSAAGQGNVEPSVPVTEPVEAEVPKPKRSKKKRVVYDSEGLPIAAHPPKRLRADYGTTGGSVTGGKSPSVLNRLLQDSRLTVEQGVPALPTLPFITSSVTASPLEEGGDRTDSVTGPSLRTIGPSARFVVLSDSSHHSGTKSGILKFDSSLSGLCSSYDWSYCFYQRSLSRYVPAQRKSNVPLWTVTKGFEMNDGRLCANMIDHFTPPAFFKTVRGMEHEQLFTEFNAKDKEIEDLKSQLLRAREESAEVTQLRAQVSGLEATENSLRGEVASAKDHNILLEQECDSLKLKGIVRELEVSSADLREKLEMYEGLLKQLEEYQDNLMGPLRTRLAEIDADFTRMKLLVVKCLNSNEYMEALGHAFGRAIEKGMQEGLAAGIEHGQAGRCLTDLEAYIPSAEDDFNSAIRGTLIDLLRLDPPNVRGETLGMTDLQPDASQLMVPVHHKQDRVIIGSQALSVALDICRGRVEKMERNLIEPPAEVPATNVLSTVVIVPHADPSVSVEDYDNPDSADVVPENAILGSESEGKIDASSGDGLTFSQLDDEARDAVL
ncbi:hypothetical protein Tco_1253882 [Tanacetum coccineum]